MPFRMSSYPYAEADMAYATNPSSESLDPYFMATSCQPTQMLYPTPVYSQDPMNAYTSAADFGYIAAPVPQHSSPHHLPGQLPLPQPPQHLHHQSQAEYTPMPSPYDPSVWVTPVLSGSPAPVHSVISTSGPMSSPMLGHTRHSSKDMSLSPNLGLTSRSSRASSFTSIGAPSYPLGSDSERGLSISGISNGAFSGSRYASHSRSTSPNTSDLRAYGHLNKNGTWTCRFPGCTSKAVFTRGCDLRKHHKRHTKSFFCRHEGCPQATGGGFSSKKDLARHEAKHDPHVLCEWTGCERVFSRVDNMRDHVKRIHLKASKNHAQAMHSHSHSSPARMIR